MMVGPRWLLPRPGCGRSQLMPGQACHLQYTYNYEREKKNVYNSDGQ